MSVAPELIPVCEPTLGELERSYVDDAMRSGWISSAGAYLDRFEREFSAKIGCRNGVTTCNGTVALHLALRALGIGPGDEVVMPSFTMVASANAVAYCGARPVFVDALPGTWTLDPEQLDAARTPRTRAVMSITIYGHPCDLEAIGQFCRRHGLRWIEDGAEGHGATSREKPLGAFADITAYSFFANKIITTGEGGMVCSNDDELAARCRYLKNLAFSLTGPRNFVHQEIGFNYRMTNLQAALGCAQTARFDELVAHRRANAADYRRLLAGLTDFVELQEEAPWATSCYWMFGLVLKPTVKQSRAEVMARLKSVGVDTRPFFHPMHLQPIFATGQSLPVSERLGERGLYLPSSSHLSPAQRARVVEALGAVLTRA